MKLCECGCGQPAPVSKYNRSQLGHVKGQPIRFIRGHNARLRPRPADPAQTGRWAAQRLYPSLGDCEAGCGQAARDRHHVDGDTSNNARENVQLLCRRCHMEADGRLEMARARMPAVQAARYA